MKMKYLYKFCLITFTLFFISCNDDDILNISEGSFGNILTPEIGQSIILNPLEDQTNTAITVSWEDAAYSVPTEINYTVEIAASGTDFDNPIAIGNTNSNALSINIANFNGYVIQAGLFPFAESDLDIRIKSSIGDEDVVPQYSSSVTISIVPFTTDLPKISVPGNHQGWNPPTAPLLAASEFGATDFEGYIWLDGEFKFLAPDDAGAFEWGNLDWGDDGSFSGILIADDESNCNAPTAGIYFVQADTDALTYSINSVSWGIIGAATPTGWDSDTDLVYNSDTSTLEVDIDLVPGEFKFRGNNEWDNGFDLGTLDDDGFIQAGGNLTFDGSAGNYHLVLDLSNPRAYTYTLTQN